MTPRVSRRFTCQNTDVELNFDELGQTQIQALCNEFIRWERILIDLLARQLTG